MKKRIIEKFDEYRDPLEWFAAGLVVGGGAIMAGFCLVCCGIGLVMLVRWLW